MNKLLTKELWSTITELSFQSERTKVAVAYLSNTATKKLHLKMGDTLVVAMSYDNLKCGQVNPWELEKYFKRGVKLFNKVNLHSKVYLFDEHIIVSSANVSINSSTGKLEEAGILTDDSNIYRSTDKMFKEYCTREILEEDLIYAKTVYQKPLGGYVNRQINDTNSNSLWIMATTSYQASDEEYEELDNSRNKFLNKLKNKMHFEIEDCRVYKRDRIAMIAKEGHRIIDICSKGNRTLVYAPAHILGVSHLYASGNPYLRIAARKDRKPKKWQDFSKFLKEIGLSTINKDGCREIKDIAKQDKIDSFFVW